MKWVCPTTVAPLILPVVGSPGLVGYFWRSEFDQSSDLFKDYQNVRRNFCVDSILANFMSPFTDDRYKTQEGCTIEATWNTLKRQC